MSIYWALYAYFEIIVCIRVSNGMHFRNAENAWSKNHTERVLSNEKDEEINIMPYGTNYSHVDTFAVNNLLYIFRSLSATVVIYLYY